MFILLNFDIEFIFDDFICVVFYFFVMVDYDGV